MIKNGVTYRVIPDHLGSPRLVVDAGTGAVAQELRYDTFGRVTLDTHPGFQPFGFAGGLYDPQTGLVRFGARDYDPEIGRWTTPDPAGFAGGLNLYAYAAQNPINFVDPAGEVPLLVVAGAVWAGAELGLSLWDAYETGKTLLDPCASIGDKVASGGGLMLGMVGPGGGYGAGAKAGKKLLPAPRGNPGLPPSKGADTRFVGAPDGTLVDTHATPRGSYTLSNDGRTDILQGHDVGAGYTHTHDPIENFHPATGKRFINGHGPGRPVTPDEVFEIMSGQATRKPPLRR